MGRGKKGGREMKARDLTRVGFRQILRAAWSVTRPERRGTMRRMVALWVVGVLAMGGLAGIWSVEAQTPVAGGTLSFAAGAAPDTLEPPNTEPKPGEQVSRRMDDNLRR